MTFSFSDSGPLNEVREKLTAAVRGFQGDTQQTAAVRAAQHVVDAEIFAPTQDAWQKIVGDGVTLKTEDKNQPRVSVSVSIGITGGVQ